MPTNKPLGTGKKLILLNVGRYEETSSSSEIKYREIKNEGKKWKDWTHAFGGLSIGFSLQLDQIIEKYGTFDYIFT